MQQTHSNSNIRAIIAGIVASGEKDKAISITKPSFLNEDRRE